MKSTLNQGYIFFYAIYGGIIIGAVYDVLALIRHICHQNKWINALLDLIFCLAAAFIILAVLFHAASGQIRISFLLGFVLGFCIYTLGIRRVLKGIAGYFSRRHKKKLLINTEKKNKLLKK